LSKSDSEAAAAEVAAVPKPGDIIYVDTARYLWHGVDDFHGGKATVSAVEMKSSSGKQVPWVQIVQRPGRTYNWAWWAKKQEELAARFGDTWAYPDPDLRPEFNNNDDW
jgi:hypothetical protein